MYVPSITSSLCLTVCFVLAAAMGSFAQSPSPSLGNYVFSVPSGWAGTQYPDGNVLKPAVQIPNENCLISAWPMRPGGGNLFVDADAAFREIFNTYEPRYQTSDGMNLQWSMIRGTSGQGWDYVILKRGIGQPRNQYGTWESIVGFVFAAKLNNQVAVISGLSKVPLVSSCFGELVRNVWPGFFYSLKFRNWNPTDQDAAMKKKMAGTWTVAAATVADQITFAENGRYGNAAARQTYSSVSSSEVLATTHAYFGNGAYSLLGNTIMLRQDDRKNQPENGFVRVEEESTDGGRSWAQVLYLLRTSIVDGSEYEVRYLRR